MEKAYDPKALLEKLKDQGLDLAEDAAGLLVEAVFDWVGESALMSETKFDDLLAGVLPVVKPHVLALIDKIDGEEG